MRRVLVVDDDEEVRGLITDALADAGIACHVACDGDEAMHRCDSGEYRVVLTDLRMPRKNGYLLAVDLLGRSRPPKVVVVTGVSESRIMDELRRCGVQDIIPKPFDASSIASKVRSLVDGDQGGDSCPAPLRDAMGHRGLLRVEESLVDLTRCFGESLDWVEGCNCDLGSPPMAMQSFVKRFARQDEFSAMLYGGAHDDRRQNPRVACPTPALAVPVDNRFTRAGEPFLATIRDVAEGGIRILHTRFTRANLLAMRWKTKALPSSTVCVVAKVLSCTPMSPFYNISAEFVMADAVV